jgi:lysophospholipase L1-like esterase
MSKPLLLLISCLSCLSLSSQKRTLVILGSSTAAGVGASQPDSSWVGRLNYYYKVVEMTLDTTINLALAGSDLYSAMPSSYINPANRPAPDTARNITAALKRSPDVIIVSFPSNSYDVYSSQEIKVVFRTISDSATAKGVECFITSTQPRTGFSAANRLLLRQYKDSILSWYGNYAFDFWDSIANPVDNTIAIPYRYSGDNIHVNNAGHNVLFRQVLGNLFLDEALPMKLKNVYAINRNNFAEIHWIVADEKPNVVYTIERSVDKANFAAIMKINATGRKEYSYTDPEELHGFTVYRIKVSSINRAFYSKMVALGGDENDVLISCYPTPVTNTVNVEIFSKKHQAADIAIINVDGNILLKKHQVLNQDRTVVNFDLGKFPSGLYTVKLTLPENRTVVQSFTKN